MSTFATRFVFLMTMVFAGAACERPAHAVQIDAGGQGQVLIYPYYTVHQGKQTLLSIINTSDLAQVLQVTFREALNGRSALQFRIWLGRKDVWTGTVFALADDGIASDGAGVLTRDSTCTTPVFATGSLTSGGARYFPLGNGNYSGVMSDGGPTELGRARHGWIEVISLATLFGLPANAMAINFSNGMPYNCGVLTTGIVNQSNSASPRGGLSGAVSIIRVQAGVVLSSRAEALSGFTGISLYNDAMQPAPDLSSVNEGMPGGAVSAMVVDELGRNQVLTYGATGSGSRPIDAVSAVLMATRVKNEYQIASSIGGSTDWVVTMPTKPFYTDPALVGVFNTSFPPFEEPFAAPGNSRICAPYRLFNQDQRELAPPHADCVFVAVGPIPSPVLPSQFVTLYQSANVVPFKSQSWPSPNQTSVFAAPGPPRAIPPDVPWHVLPWVGTAGWMEMNLATIQRNHRLPASAEGKLLSGLPVVGYSASNIVNGNVSNGVLANYGSAVRHVTTVACSKASDGSPCD